MMGVASSMSWSSRQPGWETVISMGEGRRGAGRGEARPAGKESSRMGGLSFLFVVFLYCIVIHAWFPCLEAE